jgi:hypothetical protein
MVGCFFHDIWKYVRVKVIQDRVTIEFSWMGSEQHDRDVFHEYEYYWNLND